MVYKQLLSLQDRGNMQLGIWEHYKGGFYLVIGVGEHTETNEVEVVYISLTGIHMPGPRMRIRPLNGAASFTEEVVWPDGVTRARFCYLGDEIPKET